MFLKQKFGIRKRLINHHGYLVAIESRGPVQLFSTFQIFPYPPNVETIFQAFGSKLRTKNVETFHCCVCCNPDNLRLDLERNKWSAYKRQLHSTG